MAFPVEQTAANTTQGSNVTNWGAQNMPSGIVAGDTLLAFISIDGSGRTVTATGWTILLEGATGSDGSVTLVILYKKAVGSDTLSLTISASEQGACRIVRVDTAEDPDTQAPEIGAVTTGSSANPSVGLITPIGGAKDYKFYAVCAHDRNRTFTSAPTNHQANDGTLVGGASTGAQVSWGDHDVNSATDDPDNFTYTTSDGFATVVVVVHPVATGGPILKGVGGSLAPAGNLIRFTSVTRIGSISLAGAISKQSDQAVSGSITPTGALATTVVFLLDIAGSITPTGTLVKLISILRAGSLSPTGTISKQSGQTLSGSLTPAGAVGKDTSVTVEGSLTPTGEPNPSFQTSQTVTGILTGLVGSLATLFIPPSTPSAVIQRIRGWYGCKIGRHQ